MHVRCHFQPLPTKLVFAYFDRVSHEYTTNLSKFLKLKMLPIFFSSNDFRIFIIFSMRSYGHFSGTVRREKIHHDFSVHGPLKRLLPQRRSRLWIWLNKRLLASTAAGDDATAGPHVETVLEMLERDGRGRAKWLEMYQLQ